MKRIGFLTTLALLLSHAAFATTTQVRASADAGGVTVVELGTAGAEGVSRTAANLLPGGVGSVASVNGSASAYPGLLGASASAFGAGSGPIQGRGVAGVLDSFSIAAPGYSAGEVGTFSGEAVVSGSYRLSWLGRTYSTGDVYGRVGIFPYTGFNGGFASVEQTSAASVGYDIPPSYTSPNFTLSFSNVPFTFGRGIDVEINLIVKASGIFVEGTTEARTTASLTWGGIIVHDAAGQLVSEFSAISPESGFNYRWANPVPEATTAQMLCLGLAAAGWFSRRSRRNS